MYLSLVALCLAAIVGLYFSNNPLKHSRWFILRRFINWFPLGMTYAFLYMGRYNLNVAKNAMDTLISNRDFGLIFGIGTWVYALSFLVNGPLVDKIGGKRGILIAASGAALANIALGVLTYLVLTHRVTMKLVMPFSIIYSLNMYFQSYGAVSIIKVKAYWFHVRERGVFGAIFGTLISFGVYFAFDWGQAIVNATKVGAGNSSWLAQLVQRYFRVENGSCRGDLGGLFYSGRNHDFLGGAGLVADQGHAGGSKFSASRYARRVVGADACEFHDDGIAEESIHESVDAAGGSC